MLERVERKRNTLTLLVGMQTSTATMENSVKIQKTGNRTAIRPRNPTAGHTHWGNQNWERHPMFITTLFIIARTCRQPKCPSADKWIRKLWYIYKLLYWNLRGTANPKTTIDKHTEEKKQPNPTPKLVIKPQKKRMKEKGRKNTYKNKLKTIKKIAIGTQYLSLNV